VNWTLFAVILASVFLTVLLSLLVNHISSTGINVPTALLLAMLVFLSSSAAYFQLRPVNNDRRLLAQEPQGKIASKGTSVSPSLRPSLSSNSPPRPAPHTSSTPIQPKIPVPPGPNLSVMHWGPSLGPESQVTVLLKPRIVNASSSSIPIELSNFRLVIPEEQYRVASWRSAKAAEGLQPISYSTGGRTFWLIPPNADRAAEHVGGAQTFATEWHDASSLRAGGSYSGAGDNGILAFYVPVTTELTVSGLAYVRPSSEGLAIQSYLPRDQFSPPECPHNWLFGTC